MKAIPAVLPTLLPCRLIIAKTITLYDEYWKEKKKQGYYLHSKLKQSGQRSALNWNYIEKNGRAYILL